MLTITSGRASKMHKSTPIGHVTRYKSNVPVASRPSHAGLASAMRVALVHTSRGDGSDATSDTPCTIDSHLPAFANKSRRDTSCADSLPCCTRAVASSTSRWLAARISSCACSRARRMACSALTRCASASPAGPSERRCCTSSKASRACLATTVALDSIRKKGTLSTAAKAPPWICARE